MNDRDHTEERERFVADFRRWATREPRTPAAIAVRMVRERLDRPPAGRARWRPLVAAAAVITAVLGGWWTLHETHSPPRVVGTVIASPALPDNVVLSWIEPETPVYFALGPTAPAQGGAL